MDNSIENNVDSFYCITLDNKFELYLDDVNNNDDFDTDNAEIKYKINSENDFENFNFTNISIKKIDDIQNNNLSNDIEYLINKGYIPKYLYPINLSSQDKKNKYHIDDDYIKLISNYLYKQYLYRKISGMYSYRKSYNINFGMFSKLRICTNATNIKLLNKIEENKIEENNILENDLQIDYQENDIIYSLL